MRAKAVLVPLVACVALLGAACGTASGNAAKASEETGPVEMTNVATGATETLSEALTPSDGKPTIAWFWAPSCPTCRGEAPELNEFMAENAGQVNLVGIGAHDDLDYAKDFLADTGVTNFPLLWEESGRSWTENAVAAQPYTILISADGEEIERWPGGASVTQLDDALSKLA